MDCGHRPSSIPARAAPSRSRRPRGISTARIRHCRACDFKTIAVRRGSARICSQVTMWLVERHKFPQIGEECRLFHHSSFRSGRPKSSEPVATPQKRRDCCSGLDELRRFADLPLREQTDHRHRDEYRTDEHERVAWAPISQTQVRAQWFPIPGGRGVYL